MYIEPNTSIKILNNVPLDNTYDHTIYFADRNAQTNYFTSKAKYHIDRSTYQRVNKGSLKVGLPADNLYDCNYLMFLNAGFGSKWFYAFITSVEYINDDTTLITYQIDDMQTWFFDFELEQCFVEREHSVTDRIGENTVPETIGYGDYVNLSVRRLSGKNETTFERAVAILVTGVPSELSDLGFSSPDFFGNVPQPCYVLSLTYDNDNLPQIISRLARVYSADTEGNQIIAIFVYPYQYTGFSTGGRQTDVKLPSVSVNNRADGRPPINNKLKTFPYCSYVISTPSNAVELKYELNATDRNFRIIGNFNTSGKVIGFPINYAGADKDLSHSVSLSCGVQLAWVNEGFQQYMAKHSSEINATIDNAYRTWGTGFYIQGGNVAGNPSSSNILHSIGNILSQTNSLVSTINNSVATMNYAKAMPDNLGGSIDGIDNLTASNIADFYFYAKSIRPEYVSIVDDFFTRFGYKTNRNKIPNISSRPHWNYVKTLGCTLKGSLPADSMRHICSLFDNGITFWKNGNEIGNYTLDNRPS